MADRWPQSLCSLYCAALGVPQVPLPWDTFCFPWGRGVASEMPRSPLSGTPVVLVVESSRKPNVLWSFKNVCDSVNK